MLEVNGEPLPFRSDRQGVSASASLAGRQAGVVRVGYGSHGREIWRYKRGDDVAQSRDSQLTMKTIFRDVDFPLAALSPTAKREISGGFFAFHLLLAYLVDHISIHPAFLACSIVSVFLVISYLRLVIGLRFAIVEAGTAQLIYLVLFSYAFFIPGFTGLAITIGCIVTLFAVMQMTANIRWSECFARSVR